MKTFACGQVVPGCRATFRADTDEQILAAVAVHAREDHRLESVPPELVDQVRAGISAA